MVDVVGQVVAAGLLAGLDHDDAAAARYLLLPQRPQCRETGVDRIAVVGAAAAIELVVLAHRQPGTQALRPALHLGLLVEMAVEQDGVAAVARHIHEQQRCAAGQADHLQGGAGKSFELRARPALHQRHSVFHVAVLDPLRIVGRRLVGNADVFGDGGQDRVFPERLDEMLQAGGVHGHMVCQTALSCIAQACAATIRQAQPFIAIRPSSGPSSSTPHRNQRRDPPWRVSSPTGDRATIAPR